MRAHLSVVIAVFLLVSLVTATASGANQPSTSAWFVARSGRQLVVRGVPKVFTGVNAPMAATSDALGLQCGVQIDVDLLFATMPVDALVRVWFTQAMATDQHTGRRDWRAFDRVVDAARRSARHPRLLVTLTTQSGDCDGGTWRDRAFYAGGWRSARNPGQPNTYGAFVSQVVQRYANDPTVAIWEPVNEPEAANCAPGVTGGNCYEPSMKSCPADASKALRSFFDVVGARIKRLAPHQLVSTGALGGSQCGWAGADAFTVDTSPGIDIISYHDYQAETDAMPSGLTAALTIGAALSKPVVVGEAGMNASQIGSCRTRDERVTLTLAKVRAAFGAGVSAFVLWAWAQGGPQPCDLWLEPSDPMWRALDNPEFHSATRSTSAARHAVG